jgi:hypothetical protein
MQSLIVPDTTLSQEMAAYVGNPWPYKFTPMKFSSNNYHDCHFWSMLLKGVIGSFPCKGYIGHIRTMICISHSLAKSLSVCALVTHVMNTHVLHTWRPFSSEGLAIEC